MQRWPDLRLSRPQPDYGIDFTALFPASRAVEGAVLQLQLHDAEAADGRALATVKNVLRWEEFSRGTSRGLLVAASQSPEGPRFFAIDSREAARRAAHNGTPAVVIPDAYELDDLTFALLWACASLDTGLQMDDQELTMAVGELAPYESLPSSAVSREAAAGLGTTSQIWLGSDFCARHILRNLNDVPAPPAFWTREQTGGERELVAEGDTVRDLLDDLMSRFPALEEQLPFANVYLEGEDVRTLEGQETEVHPGSTVLLLPAMAGGS